MVEACATEWEQSQAKPKPDRQGGAQLVITCYVTCRLRATDGAQYFQVLEVQHFLLKISKAILEKI